MSVVKTHNFKLGDQVHCSDGPCGKLAKMAVDPSFYEVVYLIVEEGLLLKRARVFPIEAVTQTEEGNIYLSIATDELNNYPEFTEEIVERPLNDAYVQPASTISEVGLTGANYDLGLNFVREKVRIGVPDDLAVIGQGTQLMNEDGESWKLEAVQVYDETNDIMSFAVQRGLIFTEQDHFPIEWVESIADDRITLKLTAESLSLLKSEQAAADLTTAEQTAVVTQSALVIEVQDALEADTRTRGYPIQVSQDGWTVTLDGSVNSFEAREAAGVIANDHPDVSRVNNNLTVS